MSNLANISVEQLKRAVQIRERIDSLQAELSKVLDGGEIPIPFFKGSRGMSAAGRARVSAAQKARWGKMKGEKAAKPARKKMSAAGRARIAAAAKLRWKKAKAAAKNRL